jgi:predicted dehydrogenase
LAARYLVNAGPLPRESWYGNEEMEGSRFVGEGGHFIDTLAWWVGADPIEVSAIGGAGPADVQVTIRFAEGSMGTITYLTTGHPRFQKETLDVLGHGRSARLDNFKRASVWSGRRRRLKRSLGAADKGQRGAIDAFLTTVRTGGQMPIPFSSLVATTRATLAVGPSLASGAQERV